MKKQLFLILSLFAAFTAAALSPDDFVGYWESKWQKIPTPDRSLKMKQQDAYDLAADGSMHTESQMQLTIIAHPNTIDCFFTLTAAGTWTAEGDSISMHYDPATINIDFPQDEIRISGQVDMGTVGILRSQIASQMASMLPAIKEGVKDDTYTDVVIDAKSWKAKADGREVTFNRKEKKAKK